MPNTFDIGAIGAGAATQAAEGLVGAGMGLLLEKHNDKRQIKQQQKLTDMQMKANKDMALFNYDQQMKMWEATNYDAQKKQLEKAGLNPGLLYGMSGGGGATTAAAQGGSASSGSAPTGGGEIMGMLSQKMQLALLDAQRKNIEADTANKQADTTKKSGVDTELAKGTLANVIQDTQNKKAQETLTKVQTELANIEQQYQQGTLSKRIDLLFDTDNKLINEINLLQTDLEIKQETKEAAIDAVKQELAGIILRNTQTESQTKLTNEQIKQVTQSIQTQIKQLQQTDRQLSQKDQDILIDKARNQLIETGIWVGAASGVARDMINILTHKSGR